MPPISQQLYSFSPLGAIYVRELGMDDKNGNGAIDRGAGEGYEEFVERYGIGATFEEKERSVDCGFAANGVIYGAGNGRLEEPEIVNHYYINIRFGDAFQTETDNIERDLTDEIRRSGIPLVWLDDEQGTVMAAVTRVLGAGWNEQEVTEDEAARMFYRVMDGMRIRGRTGAPSRNGGYYTLPEFVTRKAGYCFEAAQFGFWFFSQLKNNIVILTGPLDQDTQHEILALTDSDKTIDYFDGAAGYNVSWQMYSPLQELSTYYKVQGKLPQNNAKQKNLFTNAFVYDKYNLTNTAFLLNEYMLSSDYASSIILGNFALNNIDTQKILQSNRLMSQYYKEQLYFVLFYLRQSYQEHSIVDDIDNVNNLLRMIINNYN
ncbi:MAG: hypothetical protein LBD99_01845 [Candidatus Margulisbacteria bacterium]|jgi:hypothetical protein|nr:hypothetical protein [Candidatus Margulisiibacteriota bacterium]